MFSCVNEALLVFLQFSLFVAIFWGFVFFMIFIIFFAVYESIDNSAIDDVIFIKLGNENQSDNESSEYVDIVVNEDSDELPLYIRFFLDTVTEPLPTQDST